MHEAGLISQHPPVLDRCGGQEVPDNALTRMERAAAAFRARLLAEPGCTALPMPPIEMPRTGLHWENTLLAAFAFRRAHVETFNVPGRLSVLHVCIFPHLADDAPIFGFDMIAGPARVTGIFLDLSPVTQRPPRPGMRDIMDADRLDHFAQYRDLPEWCSVFSSDMLAVRPVDLAEVDAAIAIAHQALDSLLATPRTGGAARAEHAAGQARYAAAQRRNEHTYRTLAGFVGADTARRFIDEVLFPLS